MKVSRWMRCIGCVLQSLVIINCNYFINQLTKRNREQLEHLKVGNESKFKVTKDAILLHNKLNFQMDNHQDDKSNEKESVGQGRYMASYFFPFFPQFFDVDYAAVWNRLKSPATIGFFVFAHVLDVCNIASYLPFHTLL